MKRSVMSTINLGNSIIGVSILAMPFCFKHCGVLLSIAIVALSALLNYFSCSLLLKSARINRRRNYELLAYDAFGSSGKTMVEVSILLFLIGTCVAFFVIVADIGPSIISRAFNIENGPRIRALTLIFLAIGGILPCGFLRNVENLTSFSFISLVVYTFLALRMFFLSFEKFVSPTYINLWKEINYWDSSFVITYLPIFSMAFSCQPQIFEVFHYDLQQHRSYNSIMRSIKRAIYITSFVYILIGFFGYIAFYDHDFSGNILQSLPNGFITQLTLLSFLVSLLTSFPLLLFPCRTSLHSLLFRKGGYNDFLSTAHSIHMSDTHFKLLTIVIILITMGISVLFPHVELVLALIGSTVGSIICFIFPAIIFIKITDRNTVEYLLSYLLISFGLIILIFCTFSVVINISKSSSSEVENLEKVEHSPTLSAVISSTSTIANLVKTEYKSRIHNLNKLKESINNSKRQQEQLKFQQMSNPNNIGSKPDIVNQTSLKFETISAAVKMKLKLNNTVNNLFKEPNQIIHAGGDKFKMETGKIVPVSNNIDTQTNYVHVKLDKDSTLLVKNSNAMNPLIQIKPSDAFQNETSQNLQVNQSNISPIDSSAIKHSSNKVNNIPNVLPGASSNTNISHSMNHEKMQLEPANKKDESL